MIESQMKEADLQPWGVERQPFQLHQARPRLRRGPTRMIGATDSLVGWTASIVMLCQTLKYRFCSIEA
jgi:hypothetical protein